MTLPFLAADNLVDEVTALAMACLSGDASPEDAARLDEFLCNSDEACRVYVRVVSDSSTLRRWGTAEQSSPQERPDTQQLAALLSGSLDETDQSEDGEVREHGRTPFPALFGDCPNFRVSENGTVPFDAVFGDGIHGTFSSFSSGWPVAYLVATVIFGIGLLIGFVVHVSEPQVAKQFVSLPSPLSPLPSSVGRITGMVDCRWADAATEAFNGAHVPLGRKYALTSGLLEISYDAGAKVILQGPVTYEVESPAGGYLSLGKLTAKVEKKEESGKRKADYPLSTTHYPLFAVRTPTATVTDLGTEFGVEVQQSGATATHVFRGAIEVLMLSKDRQAETDANTLLLHENESALVEYDGTDSRIVPISASIRSHFVRSIESARTTHIVETFDGQGIDPALVQMPLGRYVNRSGAAQYLEPSIENGKLTRGYICTAATDFCDRDFTMEATVEIRLDSVDDKRTTHHLFLGIGDGVPNPNFYDEVTSGLVLVFAVDRGIAFVRLASSPDSMTAQVAPEGTIGSGRYRLCMRKSGKWMQFTVENILNGRRGDEFASGSVPLPNVAPFLNATNSRLIIGTGYCDTMTVRIEELSITYLDTTKKQRIIGQSWEN